MFFFQLDFTKYIEQDKKKQKLKRYLLTFKIVITVKQNIIPYRIQSFVQEN